MNAEIASAVEGALAYPYPNGYAVSMAVFLRSAEFDTWLRALKDNIGKARIVHRIRSAELGNFGDVAAVGDGVFEMRVHVGPGYRVYYARRDSEVWLLLVGGDKSTQPRDIARAKAMAAALAGSNS